MDTLPREVQATILQYVPLASLVVHRTVCKTWHKLINERLRLEGWPVRWDVVSAQAASVKLWTSRKRAILSAGELWPTFIVNRVSPADVLTIVGSVLKVRQAVMKHGGPLEWAKAVYMHTLEDATCLPPFAMKNWWQVVARHTDNSILQLRFDLNVQPQFYPDRLLFEALAADNPQLLQTCAILADAHGIVENTLLDFLIEARALDCLHWALAQELSGSKLEWCLETLLEHPLCGEQFSGCVRVAVEKLLARWPKARIAHLLFGHPRVNRQLSWPQLFWLMDTLGPLDARQLENAVFLAGWGWSYCSPSRGACEQMIACNMRFGAKRLMPLIYDRAYPASDFEWLLSKGLAHIFDATRPSQLANGLERLVTSFSLPSVRPLQDVLGVLRWTRAQQLYDAMLALCEAAKP